MEQMKQLLLTRHEYYVLCDITKGYFLQLWMGDKG